MIIYILFASDLYTLLRLLFLSYNFYFSLELITMVFLPCAQSFNVLYTYCLFKLCLTFLSSSDALSVTSPESKASQSLPAAPGLALAWCLFTIWAFLYLFVEFDFIS